MQNKLINETKLAYLYLICAGLAAALWYLWSDAGAWPLFVGTAPWLIDLFVNRRAAARTPFDSPLILFLLTAALAVWSAYDQETAWAKFWMIVTAVLLFYAFATWLKIMTQHSSAQLEQLAWLLALFGTAVAIYFLATHDWDAFPTKVASIEMIGRLLQRPLPTLAGHHLHPNVVGGMLAALLPFGIVTAVIARRQKQRLILALGIITSLFMLIGLLFSSSRGAWLAALAAFGLICFWWLVGQLSRQQPTKRRWHFLGLLLTGILLGISLWLLHPDFAASFNSQLPLLLGGANRLDLFRNSLVLLQDYPFIGAGLGSFMMLYSTYALLVHVGYIIHAHNLFLDIAIEQSLIGLAAAIWMWAIFAWLLWREARRGQIQPLLGAAACSLLTIVVHGLVEDALYGSRALLLLFVPLAFVMVLPQTELKWMRSPRHVLPTAIAALLFLFAFTGIRPLRSYVYSNVAAVQQSRAELAVYNWPEWRLQDEVRQEVNLAAAIDNYQQALTLNPQNASANRRLGQLELSLGNYAAAQQHLALAYASMPWSHTTRQLYGEALVVNGRLADGAALWAAVNNDQDQLAARLFWYEYIQDSKRKDQIQQIINNL